MTMNQFAAMFPEIPAEDTRYFVETVAMAFEETGEIESAIRLAQAKVEAMAAAATKPENQQAMAGIVWDALQA